jgi:predicted PurR-regulated permease PerM
VSIPVVVWLTVGLASMAVLSVVLVGLARQVKRLFQSVTEFNDKVQPVLLEMQRDAEQARERAERLQAQELSFPKRNRR